MPRHDDPSQLVQLAAFEGIEAHATLVDGDWTSPTQGLGATLSEGAAAALGLKVGDSIDLVSRLNDSVTAHVVVTGIWRPDRADPYWLGSALDLDGTATTGTFTTRGPFVVDRDALLALEPTRATALEWRALPDLGRLVHGRRRRPAASGSTASRHGWRPSRRAARRR